MSEAVKVSISALWRIDGLLEEKLTIKPSYSFGSMSHDFEFEGSSVYIRIFIWSYKSFNTEIPLGGGTLNERFWELNNSPSTHSVIAQIRETSEETERTQDASHGNCCSNASFLDWP